MIGRRIAKLVLHVDGGARGNPGPAAIGVVVSDPDGEPGRDASATRSARRPTTSPSTGRCCAGLELAASTAPARSSVINDSELVATQLTGVYKVKHPAMQAAARAGARRCCRALSAGASSRCRARRTPRPTRSSTRRWIGRLQLVTDVLEELRSRLQEAVAGAPLRDRSSRARRLALIEECARLASEAASAGGQPRARRARAAARSAGTAAACSCAGVNAAEPIPRRPACLRVRSTYLEQLRFSPDPGTAGLEEAMRYSLLAGGKRIRPVLALATAAAIGDRSGRASAAGGGARADPHLLADPRRPAGDG